MSPKLTIAVGLVISALFFGTIYHKQNEYLRKETKKFELFSTEMASRNCSSAMELFPKSKHGKWYEKYSEVKSEYLQYIDSGEASAGEVRDFLKCLGASNSYISYLYQIYGFEAVKDNVDNNLLSQFYQRTGTKLKLGDHERNSLKEFLEAQISDKRVLVENEILMYPESKILRRFSLPKSSSKAAVVMLNGKEVAVEFWDYTYDEMRVLSARSANNIREAADNFNAMYSNYMSGPARRDDISHLAIKRVRGGQVSIHFDNTADALTKKNLSLPIYRYCQQDYVENCTVYVNSGGDVSSSESYKSQDAKEDLRNLERALTNFLADT